MLISLVIAAWAFLSGASELVWVSLGVHWVGDVLDGFVARRSKFETAFGAEFDIVGDRVCLLAIVFAANSTMTIASWNVLVAFTACYATVDLVLSLEFRRFDLSTPSPNYFYEVSNGIYKYNWSPAAKVANTAPALLLVLMDHQSFVAGALVAYAWIVKVVSLNVTRRLEAA